MEALPQPQEGAVVMVNINWLNFTISISPFPKDTDFHFKVPVIVRKDILRNFVELMLEGTV